MNEVVKIHNDLTNEKLVKMTAKELDLFMAICYKIKDKGTNDVVVSFSELKELGNYKTSNSIEELNKELNSIIETMFFVMHIKDGSKTRHETLFDCFETDTEAKTITISVKPQYEYIFTNIAKHYTKFELAEFVSLESKYSKRLYKALKQFRRTGKYIVSKEQLYKDLDVPITYRQCDINTRVLKPSIKECEKYVKNLKCKTIPENARGKAIKGYLFTFVKEIDEDSSNAQASFSNTKNTYKKNKFNEFTQNEIDFEALEKAILNN